MVRSTLLAALGDVLKGVFQIMLVLINQTGAVAIAGKLLLWIIWDLVPKNQEHPEDTLTQYYCDKVSTSYYINCRRRSIMHDLFKWALWPMLDPGPKNPEHPEGSPTPVLL